MKRDLGKFQQAKALRQSGISIRTISNLLNISTSTASIWCRDIELSKDQKAHLTLKGKSNKLLKEYAQKRHLDKVEREEKIFLESKNQLKSISKNELFLTGLALYWAEGFKNNSEHRVGFCNSDPRMVKFIMNWFRNYLNIPKEEFTLRVEFNSTHINRKEEIESYWSSFTGIPLSQFNKPYLQKVNQIRDYSKRGAYYGLLRIRIRKSSQLLVKIRGWIEGLGSVKV